MTKQQKYFFVVLVNAMIFLGCMSTDIYLPSLPAMVRYFQTNIPLVQYTVTAFALALGVSQLIVGPLSDAYGRKKLILLALFLQLIAISGIVFVSTIYGVIAFRFLQGIGAAFMMVPARAILNDLFTGKELKKQFNYLTISFALGPIIAPYIGGYLQHYINWQASFYFAFVYALILWCLVIIFFKETIAKRRLFSIDHLWKNYHTVLSNKYFLYICIFIGFIWGYIAIFNIAGPFIVQNVFQQSAIVYGKLALLMGFAWFIGNISNRFLFDVDKNTKSNILLSSSIITTIIFYGLAKLGYFNIPTFVIPTFILILFNGMLFPMYVAEGLTLFSELAASANACLFASLWVMYGGFTIIASLLKVHSLIPISFTYMSISIFCFGLYYLKIRKIY